MSDDPPYQGGYSYMDSDTKTNFHDPRTFHDRVLLVEGKKFYIQSGLLSVWSAFFRGLFNSDFQEKNSVEIELKDLSSDKFELFLRVVYAEYLDIEEKHLESLASLSHRFLAPKVMTVCKRFIDKNFKKMDKPKLLDMACKYDMHDVKKKVLEFIEKYNDVSLYIPLAKVAFDHSLENLEKKLRERDVYHSFPELVQLRKSLNVEDTNTPVVMSDAAMKELQQEFREAEKRLENFQNTLSMTMQGGICLKFIIERKNSTFKEIFQRTLENLIFAEALELMELYRPSHIYLKDADADEVKKIWNKIKGTSAKNFFKLNVTLVGLGDMWDHNIRMISAVLAEVAAKMVEQTPGQLFIALSKTELVISSKYYSPFMGNECSTFSISFVGGWNLPTSYGTVFPLMLKTILKDINNLFIIFDLPCKSCIEWIFKHMHWTFDDSTIKPLELSYSNEERANTERDELQRNVYVYNQMGSWNEFRIEESHTTVTYFFMKRMLDRSSFGMIRLRGC